MARPFRGLFFNDNHAHCPRYTLIVTAPPRYRRFLFVSASLASLFFAHYLESLSGSGTPGTSLLNYGPQSPHNDTCLVNDCPIATGFGASAPKEQNDLHITADQDNFHAPFKHTIGLKLTPCYEPIILRQTILPLFTSSCLPNVCLAVTATYTHLRARLRIVYLLCPHPSFADYPTHNMPGRLSRELVPELGYNDRSV